MHTLKLELWTNAQRDGRSAENLPVSGLFLPKRQILGHRLQRLRTSGRDVSEMITISESHDRLARLRNVGFPTVPLQSTQSHSRRLQAAYKKRHSWTSPAHTRLALQT